MLTMFRPNGMFIPPGLVAQTTNPSLPPAPAAHASSVPDQHSSSSAAFAHSYRMMLENYAAMNQMANPYAMANVMTTAMPPMQGNNGGYMTTAMMPPPMMGGYPMLSPAMVYQQQQQQQQHVMQQQMFKPPAMVSMMSPTGVSTLNMAGHPRVDAVVMDATSRFKRPRMENPSETTTVVDEDAQSEESWQDDDHSRRSRPSPGTAKRQIKDKTPGLGGERRLKIDFTDLGVVGPKPQYFGKSGMVIPDGLCGTHEMHSQQWKFLISHETSEDNIVVIKWTVTNLNSSKTISVTETPFQAKERQKTGNTICSVVMRKAIEQRVLDLEEELKVPAVMANPAHMSSIQSLIRELRPKQRNEGILFFGLRHACVQVRSPESTAQEGTSV